MSSRTQLKRKLQSSKLLQKGGTGKIKAAFALAILVVISVQIANSVSVNNWASRFQVQSVCT